MTKTEKDRWRAIIIGLCSIALAWHLNSILNALGSLCSSILAGGGKLFSGLATFIGSLSAPTAPAVLVYAPAVLAVTATAVVVRRIANAVSRFEWLLPLLAIGQGIIADAFKDDFPYEVLPNSIAMVKTISFGFAILTLAAGDFSPTSASGSGRATNLGQLLSFARNITIGLTSGPIGGS